MINCRSVALSILCIAFANSVVMPARLTFGRSRSENWQQGPEPQLARLTTLQPARWRARHTRPCTLTVSQRPCCRDFTTELGAEVRDVVYKRLRGPLRAGGGPRLFRRMERRVQNRPRFLLP